MPESIDTIAALATPTGTSALAVLRVSGPNTRAIAEAITGGTPLPRRVRHRDYADLNGAIVDDVVTVFFAGPRSYTGEDSLEISCHGNPFIAQKILADLYQRGCRPAEPGEFTQRAFMNGRMDLSQAEAVMDLIQARSDRALDAANRQLRGSLGKKMTGLINRLVEVVARVEAYIDFPEEDLPPEDQTVIVSALDELERETGRLLATSRYGDLLRDGIKTVIVGRPNVGKSSLLNRLVGKERALVSAEPGTTRDFIEERIVVGPHCLRLIDTAGLNPSPAPLEKLGMDKTLERVAEADLYLVVLEEGDLELGLAAELVERFDLSNTVIALNKSDLRSDDGQRFQWGEVTVVEVSALTGEGIDVLERAIVACGDRFAVDVGADTVAINARHAEALSLAREALGAARIKVRENAPVELLSSDLRDVLQSYGDIAGRIDNERVLDELFASFCIGK